MKIVKYIIAATLFLIACPISWIAAWIAGSWFTVILSIFIPTYGVIYWLLAELIGNNFVQSLISLILGVVCAIPIFTYINMLVKSDK